MNAITINSISKSYGPTKALDNISLTVAEGELFGLIGPDGAGKTTLFRILTTLIDPDSGDATVAGYDIRSHYRKVRNLVGYMPGRFSLYPDLTVEENLEFFAAMFGSDLASGKELIAPIYNQIAPFAKRHAGKLSGGMKQKLALCCALIHSPRILFLDEPTTGVDAVSRNEFWQILSGLKRQGITIVASTPYMDEAGACSRVALINNGKILAVDAPEKLASNANERLFAVSATEMWRLLQELRTLPGISDSYTFGASHHIVATDSFNPSETADILRRHGLTNVAITPIKGNIEDLFIKLMRHDK